MENQAKNTGRQRNRRESGHEILEFGLVAMLFMPLLLGTFVTGMNLIKSLQANLTVRDLGNIYIHGGDFSAYSMQQLAQRLASGLNLQMPAFANGTTNLQTNTGTTGNGIVWMTQVMWIGANTDPICVATIAAGHTCVNQNSFVYTQQVVFGSSTVAASHPNALGNAVTNGASFASGGGGIVLNYAWDATAKLPTAAQTLLTTLFQDNTNGQADLIDGQAVYTAEGFFETPTISMGSVPSLGVYARSFF
jgi:hypothetical protein